MTDIPDEVAMRADEVAESIGARMAVLFQELQQSRDVNTFADGMGFVAEVIASEILHERARCAKIVMREAFVRGDGLDRTVAAIAKQIRGGVA